MSILDRFFQGFKDFVEGPGKTFVLGPKTEADVEKDLARARQAYFEKHGIRLDPNSIVDTQKALGLPSDFTFRKEDMAVELDIPDYEGKPEQNVEAIKRIKREIAKRTLKVA